MQLNLLHNILTTVMIRIVVDKSTDHVQPHLISFYHNIKDNEINNCLDLEVHVLHYANEMLVRVRLSVQKLLQTRLICRNNTKKGLGNK